MQESLAVILKLPSLQTLVSRELSHGKRKYFLKIFIDNIVLRITGCRVSSGDYELFPIHTFRNNVCADITRKGFEFTCSTLQERVIRDSSLFYVIYNMVYNLETDSMSMQT